MTDAKIRNVFFPPTVLKLMRQAQPEPAKVSLRSLMCGGEPLGEEILTWARDTLDVTINEIYGQTEVNYVVGNCHEAWDVRPGSMGRPYPGHDVAVIAADGRPLPAGETGELAVGAPDPVAFLEYWGQPDATRAKFTDDGRWLRTGDLGRADEDGYLWFESRSDDVISSAGYRIGPGRDRGVPPAPSGGRHVRGDRRRRRGARAGGQGVHPASPRQAVAATDGRDPAAGAHAPGRVRVSARVRVRRAAAHDRRRARSAAPSCAGAKRKETALPESTTRALGRGGGSPAPEPIARRWSASSSNAWLAAANELSRKMSAPEHWMVTPVSVFAHPEPARRRAMSATQERSELLELTLVDAAAAVARREIASVELVDACLARIGALDDRLRAFIAVHGRVRAAGRRGGGRDDRRRPPPRPAARRADRHQGQHRGRGPATTAGSKILADWVPDEDATVAARLKSRARSSSARRTCTSSPGAALGQPALRVRAATRGTPSASRRGRAAGRARPSPRACATARSAPTPAARSGCRPRSTASSASGRPSAG